MQADVCKFFNIEDEKLRLLCVYAWLTYASSDIKNLLREN